MNDYWEQITNGINKKKSVNISWDLFCMLIHFFIGGDESKRKYIEIALREKGDAIIQREQWINKNIKNDTRD